MLFNRKGYLKLGGIIGKDHNVIPGGARHESYNGFTKDSGFGRKGVPVMQCEENVCHKTAEVERDELIIRKEVTEEIEDLRRKFHSEKDEAEKNKIAFAAGKLLQKEILTNTVSHSKTYELEEHPLKKEY